MNHTMFRTLSAAACAALLLTFAPVPAIAQTPDGETPATEDVCAGETGAAYGLCTAYCEAMDCDSANPDANDVACGKVYDKFKAAIAPEDREPPCEITCPCVDLEYPGIPWISLIDAPDQITTVSLTDTGTGVRIVSLGGVSGTTEYFTVSVDCTDTTSGCNPPFPFGVVKTACGVYVPQGNPLTSYKTGFMPAEVQACSQLLLDAACSDTSDFKDEDYCQPM